MIVSCDNGDCTEEGLFSCELRWIDSSLYDVKLEVAKNISDWPFSELLYEDKIKNKNTISNIDKILFI